MREGNLGTKLGQLLSQRNGILVPMVADKYSVPGMSDKFFAHNYWSGWMELKVLPNRLRTNQLDFIMRMVRRGVNGCCVSFVENVWKAEATPLVVDLFKPGCFTRIECKATFLIDTLQDMQNITRVFDWIGISQYQVEK